MTVIWCMVPETWRATDIILCISVNQYLRHNLGHKKNKLFDVTKFISVLPTFRLIQQSLSRTRCWMKSLHSISVTLDRSLPFYPPNSPKYQNLKKMKKTPGDIIILHTCTKNYDQIMYGSWDMVRNRRMDRRMEKVTYRGGCPT